MAAEDNTKIIIIATIGAELTPDAKQNVAITGCNKIPMTNELHTFVRPTVNNITIKANDSAGIFAKIGNNNSFKNKDTPVFFAVRALPSKIAEAIKKKLAQFIF